ncbi:hypothetical protein ABEQ44_12545, partial [Cutibacterium acnes]
KNIEIIPCIPSDPRGLRLIFNNNINNRKHTCTWKLNNTLLNGNVAKEEIMKEMKGFLEFNENEATSYPNLWDTMKAFLRGKLIALSASKKKLERAYISSLTTHLKALEQKEANSPKRSRWQEIIKLRAEINQMETKRTIQRVNQTRSCFLFVCFCLYFVLPTFKENGLPFWVPGVLHQCSEVVYWKFLSIQMVIG